VLFANRFDEVSLTFFLLLLFLLKEKVTKSSSEFDAEESFRLEISYNELAFGRVIYSKGLKFKTLLRAMRGFMEALYFSL
jgi:hypothetical protein